MNLRERLKDGMLLLDGGTGTMLQRFGMPMGTIPETLNIEKPEWILRLHRGYLEAGSDIVYANTFGANRLKLQGTQYSVTELVGAAIRLAKEAAETFAGSKAGASGRKALAALDIGPLGQLLTPTGTLSFEEAYDLFAEIVEAGRDADLVVIETMTDLQETKAAVLAAKEHSDLPVFVTMTFEENHRTFTGCSVPAMCLTLEGLGVDAIGVNCSLGPKELLPIVEEISQWTSLPIIVKPNAGLPDPVTNTYDITPEEFCEAVGQMLPFGPRILGGCCGTDPSYIQGLRALIDGQIPEAIESESPSGSKADSPVGIDHGQTDSSRPLSVCSATHTVTVDRPRIIGERINPTGKKRFREALAAGDMDYVLRQAIEQVEAGAEILDVNVGAPGVDEKDMMVRVVRALQAVTDVPLQLDSTKPEVLEAALRAYVGKPIINSVNGEQAVMDRILPLAAKYGAAVVGLTLDENGIPPTAEGRFTIAERIIREAAKYGIKKEHVIIDCLVLTVSSEQKAARETLRAVRMVREQLGVNTCLGVSNISFGLPARGAVNTAFFTMALQSGLTLPIMNPNVSSMMWAYRAFLALSGKDENSLEFIGYAGEHKTDAEAIAELRKAPAAPPAELEAVIKERDRYRDALRAITALSASLSGADAHFPEGAASPAAAAPDSGSRGTDTEKNHDRSQDAEKPSFDKYVLRPSGHLTDCACERCRTAALLRAAFQKAGLLHSASPMPQAQGRTAESDGSLSDIAGSSSKNPSAAENEGSPKADSPADGGSDPKDAARAAGRTLSLATSEGAAILKAMETGMKHAGREETLRLLDRHDSMAIINGVLIPALDRIGEKFEKGKLFLPQLILAADVAKECFDAIKEKLAGRDSGNLEGTESGKPAGGSRGRILLATVKGDIHDIGMNSVKVILDNYGYEVIDLGRDVPPEKIVQTALEKEVPLVGLSALMTTTLGSMETTIRLLREAGVPCKVMVGGAVLTPDYAKKIGADYYAKDAKQGADIAKEVFGR